MYIVEQGTLSAVLIYLGSVPMQYDGGRREGGGGKGEEGGGGGREPCLGLKKGMCYSSYLF